MSNSDTLRHEDECNSAVNYSLSCLACPTNLKRVSSGILNNSEYFSLSSYAHGAYKTYVLF